LRTRDLFAVAKLVQFYCHTKSKAKQNMGAGIMPRCLRWRLQHIHVKNYPFLVPEFFWLAGEFCIFENGIPDGFGIRFVPVSGFAFF